MRTSLIEERPVSIGFRGESLLGSLAVPPSPLGIALVVADRGCSRQSVSRRGLARALRQAGFATMMLDLITPEEHEDELSAAALRLDVEELAARVRAGREFIRRRVGVAALPLAVVGLGGAGAAALYDAALNPRSVSALVVDCRWPDRLGLALEMVRAPVLFIVEEADAAGLLHIGQAARRLQADHSLAAVRGPRTGATRLQREEALGRNASIWLADHLPREAARPVAGPLQRAHRRGAG